MTTLGSTMSTRPASATQARRVRSELDMSRPSTAQPRSAQKRKPRPESAPVRRSASAASVAVAGNTSSKVAPAGWAAAFIEHQPGSAEAEAARRAIRESTPQKGAAPPEETTPRASPVFSPAEFEPVKVMASKVTPAVRSSLLEVEALMGQDLGCVFDVAYNGNDFEIEAALQQARRDAATRQVAEKSRVAAENEALELRSAVEALQSEHMHMQQELEEHRAAAEELPQQQHQQQQVVPPQPVVPQRATMETQTETDRGGIAAAAVAKAAAAELEAARAEAGRASELAGSELAQVRAEITELQSMAHSACEERGTLQAKLEEAELARSREVARRAIAEGALADAEQGTADAENAAALAAASAIAKIMQAKTAASEAVQVSDARAEEAEAQLATVVAELGAVKVLRVADSSSTHDSEVGQAEEAAALAKVEAARLRQQLADLNSAFAQERASFDSKIWAERSLVKELGAELESTATERDTASEQLVVVTAQLESARADAAAEQDGPQKAAAVLREMDALKALHSESTAALEQKLSEARDAREVEVEAKAELRLELDAANMKVAATSTAAARADATAAEAADVFRLEMAQTQEERTMESERCAILMASAEEDRRAHEAHTAQLQVELAAAVEAAEEAERQRERGVAAAAAAAADIVRNRSRATRGGSAGAGGLSANAEAEARRAADRAKRAAAPPAERWPDL